MVRQLLDVVTQLIPEPSNAAIALAQLESLPPCELSEKWGERASRIRDARGSRPDLSVRGKEGFQV